MDARLGLAVSRKSKKASLIPMKAKHPEDRKSSLANDQYCIRGRKDGKKECQGLDGKTVCSYPTSRFQGKLNLSRCDKNSNHEPMSLKTFSRCSLCHSFMIFLFSELFPLFI